METFVSECPFKKETQGQAFSFECYNIFPKLLICTTPSVNSFCKISGCHLLSSQVATIKLDQIKKAILILMDTFVIVALNDCLWC